MYSIFFCAHYQLWNVPQHSFCRLLLLNIHAVNKVYLYFSVRSGNNCGMLPKPMGLLVGLPRYSQEEEEQQQQQGLEQYLWLGLVKNVAGLCTETPPSSAG